MTEVWGTLAKSQIDPQTVDEAIAAAIAAHEADTSAHVDVGESLYSHKASEVIDHVARSVVADKFSIGLFSNDFNIWPMISLDAFDVSAYFQLLNLGSVILTTSNVLNNILYMQCLESNLSLADFTKDIYWEQTVMFGGTNTPPYDYEGFFGMGLDSEMYLGFWFTETGLSSFTYSTETEGGSGQEITGISPDTYYNLAIKFYHGVRAEFYVDGVLRSTVTTNLPTTEEAVATYTYAKNKRSGAGARVEVGTTVFKCGAVLET